MRVLLVESDEKTSATLTLALTNRQFSVDVTSDSQTAVRMVQTYNYDLLVLDAELPGDGISLCRTLRSQNYQMPILLLTEREGSRKRVIGLNAGADDCLDKPFDLTEFIARVQALLRRRQVNFTPMLNWGALQLLPDLRQVTWEGMPLNLTAKEFSLLQLFLENPLRIFSKDVILDRLWNASEAPGEGTVASHVKGLRQKLKAAGVTAELIETIYGLGYRLIPPPEETAPVASQTAVAERELGDARQNDRVRAHQDIMAELAQVQAELKASLQEEVAVFEQVISSLLAGTLESTLRQQAARQAHQLAGTLGSLGLLEGSQVVWQIEQLLQDGGSSGQNFLGRNFPGQNSPEQDSPGRTSPEQDSPEPNSLAQAEAGQLLQLVQSLRQAVDATPAIAVPVPVPKVTAGRLLVIDDDVVLTKLLKQAAIAAGFHVEVATTLAEGRSAIDRMSPDVILLDLIFPETTENGFALLAELAEQNSAIPVVALTVRNSLADRVTVARLGGQAFLHKPISIAEVLRVVTKIVNPAPLPDAQVLVVDDDPTVLETLIELLPPWGMRVTTLADPQQFWEVFTATAPDLLILDSTMPTFSGIELCQVVRQDPQFADLPILILTPYDDADVIHQIFAAGADDFVGKPIVPPELIARTTRWLERTRLRKRNRP
nr:response regulator [Leptolyngbya ohadii]